MFILYKNARRFASQRIEREVSFSKKFYSAAPLCRPSKKTERRAKPFRASIVPGGVYGGGLRALPQFAMVVPRRAQSALAALPCSLGLLRAASRTARALRAPLWSIPPARLRRATSLWSQREALIVDKPLVCQRGITRPLANQRFAASDRDGNVFFSANASICSRKIPEMTYTPSFLIRTFFLSRLCQ